MSLLTAFMALGLLSLIPLIVQSTQGSQANMAAAKLGNPAANMKISSAAFAAGAAIPEMHSGYGQNISPPLEWSGQPATTKTFALILEDPDAKAAAPEPFVHWLLYNLPASTKSLPESVPTTPRLEEFGGALQGQNMRGSVGYFGPRPPAGDPPHHYYFEVFALDTDLQLPTAADKPALVAAMKGHVLGRGELIGTFKR